MGHARRARVRARHQPVGGDGGVSLLMKHMHGERVIFANFSNFARVTHGNSFSANRVRIWRGEDSSGRGCRKMRRGVEAGEIGFWTRSRAAALGVA